MIDHPSLPKYVYSSGNDNQVKRKCLELIVALLLCRMLQLHIQEIYLKRTTHPDCIFKAASAEPQNLPSPTPVMIVAHYYSPDL